MCYGYASHASLTLRTHNFNSSVPMMEAQSRENNGRTMRVIVNLYTVMVHVTSDNTFGQNLSHANSVVNSLGKQNSAMGVLSG